jgi:hypothetical protein
LEELEKIVNTLREKREGEKRKFRTELGNDSPAPLSNPSAVVSSSTPNIVQSEAIPSVIPTTTTTTEETNNEPTVINGKSTKKQDGENSHESQTENTNRHHYRRKRSSSRSR